MASVFLGINARTYTFQFVAGRSEFQGTGFRNPMDMALAPDDVIYVVNRSYESRSDGTRINVFRLGEDGEEYITEFGSYGDGPGQFIWPISIAVASNVNVYVADEWLNRINVYSQDGEFLREWGSKGSGDGELNRPSGLAIAKDGTMFVVDSLNHRVQRFTLNGEYLDQFGSFGSGPGQLNTPWGIGLDKDGNVFVADWRNDRIQQFTAQGEWQASFGQPGTGGDTSIAREMGGFKRADVPVGQFNRPAGVCVDADGDIYVADWLNNRVQVLTPEGRFISEFTGDAGLSKWGVDKIRSNPDMIRQRNGVRDFTPEKVIWAPCAVKVDANGRVIICDTTRHRFQIYQKNTEPVLI
ncbi:MAG: NHL repeat-containing protein [Dehalococcoidia bacterium]|nr:NHL repeat-containing protein [Dehalococcoidia bacterium]